jgi:hypothetical protein
MDRKGFAIDDGDPKSSEQAVGAAIIDERRGAESGLLVILE